MKNYSNASIINTTVLLMLLSPFTAVAEDTESPSVGATASAVQAPATGYYAEGFVFVPKLLVSGVRSDNIYATDNYRVNDFLTIVSPSLDVRSNWQQHALRLRLGADIARYHEHIAENYTDYFFDVSGRYDLSKDSNLFGGFSHSKKHEGRDSADANLSGTEPTTYTSQQLYAGFGQAWGRDSLRVGATLEDLSYDNVPSSTGTLINDVRDRKMLGLGARFNRKLDDKRLIYLQGSLDERDYDSLDFYGYQRDSSGYRAGVGMEQSLGSYSKLQVYLGILNQRFDDPRFSTLNKPDVATKLTYLVAPRTLLSVNLERSLEETTQAGAAGSLDTTLSARLERYLNDKVSGHVQLTATEADYLDMGRSDDLRGAGVGLKYFLTRDLYLAADYLYRERDSNDQTLLGPLSGASYDYRENQFWLTLGMLPYPKSSLAAASMPLHGTAEIGLGYLSEDSLRFGRYNGLSEQGTHAIANLDVRAANRAGNEYSRLSVQDAALDTRSVDFLWGKLGAYRAYLEYVEQPALRFDGQTVFNSVGTDTLTLPTNWTAADSTADMSTLATSLTEVQLGTQRKRVGVGAVLPSLHGWNFSVDFSDETKEGLQPIAGVLGHSPGNARATLLPMPVDYSDQKLDIALGYVRGKGHFDVRYHASFFTNANDSLTWESPFTTTGSRYSDGSLALPPDNQLHRLSLSGAYLLPANSRLTASYSRGVLLQDEGFQPYTINPGFDRPLPRDSLDGKIYLNNALLSLTSRPVRDLYLNAAYKLDERDNHTASETYDYVWADSQDVDLPRTATATNQPYSYKKQRWSLDAKYRVHRRADVLLGYVNETAERSPAEVSKTDEDRYDLKVKTRPSDTVQLALGVGTADRDGSGYVPDSTDNPLLRKYYLADRARDDAKVDLSWQPVSRIAVTASAQFAEDDYTDSMVGLTDARQETYVLDTSLQMDEDTQVYVFYNRDNITSRQAGSLDGSGDTPPPDWLPNWFADNDDQVDSIGIGAKRARLAGGRLDVGADYVYSKSRGQISITDTTDPAVTLLDPGLPYPELKTTVETVKLYADYRVDKRTKLRMSFVHESYSSKDWALDGVGVDGLSSVLLLGEESPNYSVNYLGMSLQYRF